MPAFFIDKVECGLNIFFFILGPKNNILKLKTALFFFCSMAHSYSEDLSWYVIRWKHMLYTIEIFPRLDWKLFTKMYFYRNKKKLKFSVSTEQNCQKHKKRMKSSKFSSGTKKLYFLHMSHVNSENYNEKCEMYNSSFECWINLFSA